MREFTNWFETTLSVPASKTRGIPGRHRAGHLRVRGHLGGSLQSLVHNSLLQRSISSSLSRGQLHLFPNIPQAEKKATG